MNGLPWFKVWPSEMMETPEWRRLSPDARMLLSLALMVQGRARSLDRLPTIDDLADYSGIQPRKLERLVDELVIAEFFERLPEVSRAFRVRLFDVFQQFTKRSDRSKGRRYKDSSEKDDPQSTVEERGEKREERYSETNVSVPADDCAAAPSSPPSENAAKAKKTPKPRKARDPVDLSKPHVWPSIDDPSLPDWVRDVRRAIVGLSERALETLDPGERFMLARYHAWRWANCTRDELANRRAAVRIASGLTNLATDRRYRDVDIGEYVHLGDLAWTRRGRSPMHSAWEVIGGLELEERAS